MSQSDPQGIQFPTANQAGMEHYANAVQEMSCFQASVFDSAAAAIAANPTFAMPYFTLAYLNLYMTEPSCERLSRTASIRRGAPVSRS